MKPGDTGSEQKREERQQKAHRLSTQGLINNRPQVNTEERWEPNKGRKWKVKQDRTSK